MKVLNGVLGVHILVLTSSLRWWQCLETELQRTILGLSENIKRALAAKILSFVSLGTFDQLRLFGFPPSTEIRKGGLIMIDERDNTISTLEPASTSEAGKQPKDPTRRQFLGRAGVAATFGAGLLATPSAALAQSSTNTATSIPLPSGVTDSRVIDAFKLRVGEAIQDALVPAATNVDNGDDARYPDKGGTYTKGLPHDAFGRVDLTAYGTLKTALASRAFSDFEKIIVGGTR